MPRCRIEEKFVLHTRWSATAGEDAAQLDGVSFQNAEGIKTIFRGCRFTGGTFGGLGLWDADLSGCIIDGARLCRADFYRVLAAGTVFRNITVLSECNFSFNIGTPDAPVMIEGDDAIEWILAGGDDGRHAVSF